MGDTEQLASSRRPMSRSEKAARLVDGTDRTPITSPPAQSGSAGIDLTRNP